MTVQGIFTQHIAANFDYPCPAVQDAIDRLVDAEGFRGRLGMIEAMNGPFYGAMRFNSSLLSAWKDADISLATGRGRDWWLDLAERMHR
jgi:hypothetical protein